MSNKPHDMGGLPGGAIVPDFGKEAVFKEDWHGRALALTLAAGALGRWNLDASRNARECLPADDYNRFSYYEKWLAGLTNLLVDHQLVSPDELRAGQANKEAADIAATALPAAKVPAVLKKGGPTRRAIAAEPRFIVGDVVTTKTLSQISSQQNNHTRLPYYASVKKGVIIACHDAHILPDSHAHFKGEAPEYLYGVRFLAGGLFSDPERPGDEICLDLFESYLQPVKI
jgi:nitrile hydratase subunit beta